VLEEGKRNLRLKAYQGKGFGDFAREVDPRIGWKVGLAKVCSVCLFHLRMRVIGESGILKEKREIEP
jgi:hypothetical protein